MGWPMAKAPAIKAEVHGEKKAALDLRALGVRASDVRPASRKLFRIFEGAETAQFASHRDWPPLADATLESKAAAGYPAEILVRTGALRASLTKPRDSEAVREPHAGELEFGTRLPYAHFALGTERQPKRLLIKLRRSDEREIAKTLGTYITKGRT